MTTHLFYLVYLYLTRQVSKEQILTVVAKSFENDTNIHFHKVCCLSLYDGNLQILQNVIKSDLEELQFIAKSLFAMQMN